MKDHKNITKKSQSQKIRAILYRLWEQDNEGIEFFEDYYNNKTQKYIDFLLKNSTFKKFDIPIENEEIY